VIGCRQRPALVTPKDCPATGVGQCSNAQLGPPGVAAARSPAVIRRDVVTEGNLVTSRGPQDMTTLVPAIIDHFAGTAPEAPAAVPGQVSNPQLASPVGWAVAALR
jgi:hypothetical protein